MPDEPALSMLERRGVAIEQSPLHALHGAGDALSKVVLADGREVATDAMFLAPRSRLNSPMAKRLGYALHDGPFGPVIRKNAAKLTSVQGVYATAPRTTPRWPTGDGGHLAPSVTRVRGGRSVRTRP